MNSGITDLVIAAAAEFIEPGSINPDASIDNECPSN